jgi:predicted  nucleic acid-binding Zn-ribbon protein
MLLNEFLKEHRRVEQMQKQIETLTADLQKLSAQLARGQVHVAAATGLELNRSAPQTVRNGH